MDTPHQARRSSHRKSKIGHRRSLVGMFVLLLLLLPNGCRMGGRGVVTVRFWNGFTGPDGRTMLRLVKRFNEQNPDVHVLMQRMDWSTYYKKLFVAGIGDRAPEVFVIQTYAMKRFASAGFARPNDDLIQGPDGIDSNDLDANVWSSVEFDGKHYGVPLDVFILGMYYNRKMFRDAGLVDSRGEPKVPTDRAEFLQTLQKLTQPSNGGQSAKWGFVFTNLGSNVFTFMRQYGGEMFTSDYSRCTLNDPRNVAALQYCVDLIRKCHVAPPPENFDAWIGFRQGKVAMAFEGIYMLADLQKQKDLDYGGAPVPQVGERKATWAGSHNLCLRADLKRVELTASWRFIKYLSDNSLDWAEGGQVPVRKSLRNTRRFQEMPVQSAFARQITFVNYFPSLNYIFEFETEFNNAVESALRGTKSPQEALDIATANVNKIIARDNEANLTRGENHGG